MSAVTYRDDSRESLERNLRDAGCEQEFIERFLRAGEEDRRKLLCCQRCRLLERLHEEQKKLDCLDYLRYKMQKPDGEDPCSSQK